MNVKTNIYTQIFGVAGQVFNVASGFVPVKWQFAVAGGLGIAQAIAAAISHYRNPDGSKIEVKAGN